MPQTPDPGPERLAQEPEGLVLGLQWACLGVSLGLCGVVKSSRSPEGTQAWFWSPAGAVFEELLFSELPGSPRRGSWCSGEGALTSLPAPGKIAGLQRAGEGLHRIKARRSQIGPRSQELVLACWVRRRAGDRRLWEKSSGEGGGRGTGWDEAGHQGTFEAGALVGRRLGASSSYKMRLGVGDGASACHCLRPGLRSQTMELI